MWCLDLLQPFFNHEEANQHAQDGRAEERTWVLDDVVKVLNSTTLGLWLLVTWDNKSIHCCSHSELSFLLPDSYLFHFLTLIMKFWMCQQYKSYFRVDYWMMLRPLSLSLCWRVPQRGECVILVECQKAQSRDMELGSKADSPGLGKPLQ